MEFHGLRKILSFIADFEQANSAGWAAKLPPQKRLIPLILSLSFYAFQNKKRNINGSPLTRWVQWSRRQNVINLGFHRTSPKLMHS